MDKTPLLARFWRALGIGGLLVLGFGALKPVQAASSDTIRISVTPTVTYGVTITSVNASGYDFGTVALAATTQSTASIILTNTGNVAEFFSLAVSNTSGSWAPTTSAPTADNFRMGAILNAGTMPAVGSFSDYLVNTPPGTAGSLYGQGGSKTNPTLTKRLWLKLEMPQTLTTGGIGAQTMTITVNGQVL